MHRVPEFERFVDARGEIRDLLRDVELDGVTLITTHRGGIRGNHYHRNTSQWTYVISGRLRWVTQKPGGEAQEDMVGPGSFVLSPPNERHAMIAEENTTMIVFTRGPRSGANYESDTIRLDDPLI
jgi:oxalate decarboxylase/phosphoglucose isomerase-like protein (cupin superfamily)